MNHPRRPLSPRGTLTRVRCPKCGAEMCPDRGSAGETERCPAGDMQLSRHLFNGLATYVTRPPEERTGKQWDRSPGPGPWYCPACGTPAKFEGGYLRCLECGGVLNGFVYELIELPAHRGWALDNEA